MLIPLLHNFSCGKTILTKNNFLGMLSIISYCNTIFLFCKVWTIQQNLDNVTSHLNEVQNGKQISAISVQKIEQKMNSFEKKVIKLEKESKSCLECDAMTAVQESSVDMNESQKSSSRLKESLRETSYKIHSDLKSRLFNRKVKHSQSKLVSSYNDSKNRKLQFNDTAAFELDKNNLSTKRICDQNPLLFPSNHINNFTYDDKLEQLMILINTISSSNLLHQYDSPQYKAACHLMFEDSNEDVIQIDLLIERYVMLVFLYSTTLYDESVFPSNVCDVVGIECDSMSRNIIAIQLGKYFCISQ